MKKELFAGALLLALFAGSIINTHYIRSLADELTDKLELSSAYCENGSYDLALTSAKEAMERWDSVSHYAGVFIRHSETDSITYALDDLTATLASDEPADAAELYASLETHVDSLYEYERVSLANIF